VTWADGQGNWEDGYNSGALRKAVDAGLIDMNDCGNLEVQAVIPKARSCCARRCRGRQGKDDRADDGLHERDVDCAYNVAAGETWASSRSPTTPTCR
jgi:phosphonate transport system substrate-binding protein